MTDELVNTVTHRDLILIHQTCKIDAVWHHPWMVLHIGHIAQSLHAH